MLFTKEEALQIREAIDAARSFIKCGAPAGETVHNELNNAVALIGKATE